MGTWHLLGVIVARREDTAIFGLQDLAGKRIASRSIESLPGMMMQSRELLVAGMEPLADIPEVRRSRLDETAAPNSCCLQWIFTDFTRDPISLVLEGLADAAFLRSDELDGRKLPRGGRRVL